MSDENLIYEFQSKISNIIQKENLLPLSGKDDSYELNGKQLLSWHNEATRHCWCHFNAHFNYTKNLDDILLCSDEIVYFTAHLFFYKPYINTPIKDAYLAGKKMIYPIFINVPGKRYNMFISILWEKVYNYWDRIGDLIASFFPNKFKGNIYFSATINGLENEYKGNHDYDWLKKFVDEEYKIFNAARINSVHYISNSTNVKWEQLEQVWDFEKSKKLTDTILSYPDYFKNMNELTKIGFEKTINLLEEINRRENYRCPEH